MESFIQDGSGWFLIALGSTSVLLSCFLFWRAEKQSAAASRPAEASSETQLIPLHQVVWKRERFVRKAMHQLRDLGFVKIGAYLAKDLGDTQMGVLAHPQEGCSAVIYEQSEQGSWFDLIVRYEDGSQLTVTNSKRNEKEFPSLVNRRVVSKNMTAGELFALLKRELEQTRFKCVEPLTADRFQEVFEEAYRVEMDWQRVNEVSALQHKESLIPPRNEAADARCAPVFLAIEARDLEGLKTLLAQDPRMDGRDQRSRTPLIAAVATDKIEWVTAVLEAGADPNELAAATLRDAGLGRDALDQVNHELLGSKLRVFSGSLQSVMSGLSGDISHTRYTTPLIAAIEEGSPVIVRELLAEGADVQGSGVTAPLAVAAVEGDEQVLELLLAAGAGLEQANEEGMTPLMLACRAGYSDCVLRLIDAGADVNAVNAEGVSALLCAAEAGHRSVAATLAPLVREEIRSVAENNTAGWGLGNRDEDARRELIRRMLDAAAKGKRPVVEKLLNQGLSPDASEETDEALRVTPLMVATQYGHLDVMKVLIKAGANIHLVAEGQSVLQRALVPLFMTQQRQRAGIRLLVEAGARLDEADEEGRTPLLYAIAEGEKNVDAVRELLSLGAQLDVADACGRRALDLAQENKDSEMIRLIQSH